MIRETKDELLKVWLTYITEDERKHHRNIRLILDSDMHSHLNPLQKHNIKSQFYGVIVGNFLT